MIFAFIAAFGLLVGPVNLFVFCRGGRRYRVAWVTPLISIGASVLIAAGILLHDGTGGAGERQAVIELLPERHEMLVRQEQIARTGVLLGSGFRTAETAWVEPLALQDEHELTETAQLYRTGDTFSGDWFNSRALHGQYLEAVRPGRARFELSGDNAAPRLVSSLPDTLQDVYFLDHDSEPWHAGPVEPGRPVTLERATRPAFQNWLTAATLYHGPRLQRALALGPGTLVGTARRSGAALPTLAAVTWHDRDALYLQRVER
jgi:hypothetical protein